jgi:glucose/mannose-6-phosphate isomerase
MLGHLHNIPKLYQEAWQKTLEFDLPHNYAEINKIIILGMGGSAIGGDLVKSLVASETTIPIIIHRDFNLPTVVDDKTLVIASSYSGNTIETLTAFSKVLKTKVKKLIITSGGELKAISARKGIPLFNIEYQTQPRNALCFNFLAILGTLQKLRIISDMSTEIQKTIDILYQVNKEVSEKVLLNKNPSKQLAINLYSRLITVYGGSFLSAVAHRWKTQINENSKSWAFWEFFPEICHNTIEGYQFPSRLADQVIIIMLYSPLLSDQIKNQYLATNHLLEKYGIDYHVVNGQGDSYLSQMMSLIQFGDYTSYYLALLNQVDPTPVNNIALLKRK